MAVKRRIIFVTYEGGVLLDLSGPSAVFSTASQEGGGALYEVIAASPAGGLVTQQCGHRMMTEELAKIQFTENDTVFVVGGSAESLYQVARDEVMHAALRRAAEEGERFGSICTGAFVLGAAGLLDGKCVTTHWKALEQLSALFPATSVESGSLYTADGRLWTSAGVTAGIDLALAMVEHDHGAALKAKTARQLVVYAHRPGYQAQFSDRLEAQSLVDEKFAGLMDWLVENVSRPIKVEDMASRMRMSPRSFHRHFVSHVGQSPGKFFEKVRLDQARALIEAGVAVKAAAPKVGFRSESSFRTAFKEQFGVTPRHYAQMGVPS